MFVFLWKLLSCVCVGQKNKWTAPWQRQRVYSTQQCSRGDHVYFEGGQQKFHAIISHINVQTIQLLCFYEPHLYAKVFHRSSAPETKVAGFCRMEKHVCQSKTKLFRVIYTHRHDRELTVARARRAWDEAPLEAASNVDFARQSVVDKDDKLLIVDAEEKAFQILFKLSAHYALTSSILDLGASVALTTVGLAKATAIRSVTEATLSAAGSFVATTLTESVHTGVYLTKKRTDVSRGRLPRSVFRVIVAEEVTRATNCIAGATVGAVIGEMVVPLAGIGAAVGGGIGGLIGLFVGIFSGKLAGRAVEISQQSIRRKRNSADAPDKRATYISINGPPFLIEQSRSVFYLLGEEKNSSPQQNNM